jgi:hypothetical protein
MTRQQWIIVAVLGISVLCIWCAGIFIVAQQMLGADVQIANLFVSATHTPRPTATPMETPTPSATPTAIPTATRVFAPPPPPPTRTPAPPNPLSNAWAKAETATAYRMDFDMTMKGALGNIPGVTGATQELSLFTMTGAIAGKDSHIVFKGFIASFLGGDPAKGFEMMTVGGKTYIRGPLAMMGATENKWYVGGTGQVTSSLPSADDFIGKSSSQNVDWNIFKKTSTETFDNRRCDVYTGDKNAALTMFQALDLQSTTDFNALSQLDSADIKFWVCDDGYMHQLVMNMEAHDAKKPTDKITMLLRVHLYDFNANIKITPPANAAPLTGSFFGIVTSTPTPKRN